MLVQKDLHIAIQYFLNGNLEPELIRKQVRELETGGYKCIYGHARQGLTTPYLSENWWRAIDVIVNECESLGIKFAIWDEDYYPSPSAGNRVMWSDPSLASQQLQFTVFEAHTGRIHHILEAAPLLACFAVIGKKLHDISAYCGTVCDQWVYRVESQNPYSAVLKVGAPHWRAGLTHRCYAVEWDAPADCTIVAIQIQRNFGPGPNADVLNVEAIRAFLRMTQEQYLARYGQEKFDRVFAGTFMDEPAPWGRFPWTGLYPEEFRKRFGKDLIPLLPHLVLDIDENSRLHRLHYRDIQRELLCRNYLGTMQAWCNEHNISSIGHLSRTEHLSSSNYLWPNELRCCKHLDLPCTDPLGANMGWPDTASYHTGLKVVSSAAYWYDKPQAGSDALAVCGSETDLSTLRYMADYQMVFGITYFNLHGAAVSWAGSRKDEVPPSLFYQHTQWPLMKALWKHVDETCHRLARGKEHVSFVVYYPAAQFVTGVNGAFDRQLEMRVHLLLESLMSTHKEFVLIDGITLGEQNSDDFAQRYPYIVIPDGVTFFEPEIEAFFQAYSSAGGRIVKQGALKDLPGIDLHGDGAENIFIHRRELPDGTLDTYLFNRSESLFRGTLEGQPVEAPPRSGCFAVPPRPAVTDACIPVGPWRITFGDNMIPLCRFSTDMDDQGNLLLRHPCKIPEDGKYVTRFMAQGKFSTLRLVTDAETCSAPCKIFLNDHELATPATGRFYDEENHFYDLLPFLRTGSVPTQNTLRIECMGELREVSYLTGNFCAEFRHGGCALPYLTGAEPMKMVERLADWREWGYGAYSGCIVYETELKIPQTGAYRLSLGKIESAAEIFINGSPCAVVYSAPYEIDLPELKTGSCTLSLQVYNAPGNRDRLSGRPAGLLGPVKLLVL